MKIASSKVGWTIGLLSVSATVMAAEPKSGHPHEPVGFVTGAVIGGFAAGPVGALVGAGLGTWLGNRVHRASDAKAAEAQVAALEKAKTQLQVDNMELQADKSVLLTENQSLSSKLEDGAPGAVPDVSTATVGSGDASGVLDGFEGDVLFRTGSAAITPEIAHQVQILAQAMSKSPALKVRVDGYTDPRGGDEANMKLSQERANAIRDLLVAAGLSEDVMEINAYGKTQSVAQDTDGYALERRVRLTLRAEGAVAVAQVGHDQ